MAADIRFDRYGGAVRALMVLAPLAIGFYPLTGLVNPLWGSLFGFPLRLAGNGAYPVLDVMAFLLWPVLVIFGMIWLSGEIVRARYPWRLPVVLLWLVSALVVVPLNRAADAFPGWPIYAPPY